MEKFSANGKLLISGEYAVLDGALALAVPSRFGQTLEVSYSEDVAHPKLYWTALLNDDTKWFNAVFDLKNLSLIQSSEEKYGLKLNEILKAAEKLKNGCFTSENQNVYCTTRLGFAKDWGLGSSSTLISLLAQLTDTDPFELNQLTFNTSGYDIAAATSQSPFFYQLKENQRLIEPVEFNPPFKNQLFFVHLNQKQDTQISVLKNYKNIEKDKDWLNGISAISYNMQKTIAVEEFERLIELHEEMIASKLNFKKVKQVFFPDYKGAVKSLGAWGGDFVLITAQGNFMDYFKSKGFNTILSFDEMVF